MGIMSMGITPYPFILIRNNFKINISNTVKKRIFSHYYLPTFTLLRELKHYHLIFSLKILGTSKYSQSGKK